MLNSGASKSWLNTGYFVGNTMVIIGDSWLIVVTKFHKAIGYHAEL